jgi:hypothetical protein
MATFLGKTLSYCLLSLYLMFGASLTSGKEPSQTASDPDPKIPELTSLPNDPHGTPNPYWTHAPLALFGVGSLAVGGVVLFIQKDATQNDRTVEWGKENQARMAIGFAGVGALAATWAYFYFARQEPSIVKNAEVHSPVEFSLSPEGGWGLQAIWRLPRI